DVWQPVSWVHDGVKFVAHYHPARRSGAFTWILLHGLGSVKEEWEPFANKLVMEGNGAFLYDARGHHESNQLSNGRTIDYKDWHNAGPGTPWSEMPGDLESAISLLEKQYHVSEKQIALGGASLGANVALVVASKHPEVPALVLLSPGIE